MLVLEKLVSRLEIDETRVELTVDEKGAVPAEKFDATTVHDGAVFEPIGRVFHSKADHIDIPVFLQTHLPLWHYSWSEYFTALFIGIVDAVVQNFTDVFVVHAIED
jgi:hypothetical protein